MSAMSASVPMGAGLFASETDENTDDDERHSLREERVGRSWGVGLAFECVGGAAQGSLLFVAVKNPVLETQNGTR